MSALCKAAIAGDTQKARSIQYQLLAVHKMMFIEANPIPVKWALHQMGKIESGIRLPLTPLSKALQESLKQALENANLV
jgi:4-hydroxy-tetrahydrodipicolinate synthase